MIRSMLKSEVQNVQKYQLNVTDDKLCVNSDVRNCRMQQVEKFLANLSINYSHLHFLIFATVRADLYRKRFCKQLK